MRRVQNSESMEGGSDIESAIRNSAIMPSLDPSLLDPSALTPEMATMPESNVVSPEDILAQAQQVEPAPAAAQTPAISRFPALAGAMPSEDIMTKFGKAQENARSVAGDSALQRSTNALLSGAAQYSGAKPDLSAANEANDAVTKIAQSKASDMANQQKFGQELDQGKLLGLKTKATTDSMDPNSDASISFRKAVEANVPDLSKVYGPLWSKVTAADKDSIWDFIKLREQIKARQELNAASLADKADARLSKAEEKKANEPMTAGRKKLDQDFAKDYNDWTSQGRSSLDKNIERLEEAKATLQAGEADSGRFVGRLPDALKPESLIRTRDDVHAAAVAGLRAALGAQFTEKEGERIQGYSFNQNLSPQENVKKVDAAIKELKDQKAQKEAKARHFEQNGTLTGYSSDTVRSSANPSEDPKIAEYAKQYGLDYQHAADILKKRGYGK